VWSAAVSASLHIAGGQAGKRKWTITNQVDLTINADQLGQALFEIASEFFRNSQRMKDELGEVPGNV